MRQISFGQSLKGTPEWDKQNAIFQKGKLSSQAIFEHATRVEAFRLIGNPAATTTRNFGAVQGFAATNKIIVSNPTFARELERIVLDENSYVMPGQGMTQCYIEPGVAFRVWSGAKFVDCILCFHCNQLGVVENDPRVPVRQIGGALRGRMNVLGDFDPARKPLLALAKRAFPDDGELQALR